MENNVLNSRLWGRTTRGRKGKRLIKKLNKGGKTIIKKEGFEKRSSKKKIYSREGMLRKKKEKLKKKTINIKRVC